jgi:hypothetical protein
MIKVAQYKLNPQAHWYNPISQLLPTREDLDLFDQNGYDLTVLEQKFALANDTEILNHRSHRTAIKMPWFVESTERIEGPHLNHSLLFERKGYAGEARQQLEAWAVELPLLHKILAMRPKWGLDFSIDYADRAGNSFEVLHWEYDGFSYEEIEDVRTKIEPKLSGIDWDDAAQSILANKSEWHHLDFFAQSDWKCNYFGIPKEKFKMVAWS